MRCVKEKPLSRFLFMSYIGIVLFVFVTIIGNGLGTNWLVVDDEYGHTFSDHFKHIVYASDLKQLYFNTGDAAFPPFAYLLYRLLFLINPGSWGVDDWKLCMNQGINLLVFFALTIIVVIFYMYICTKVLEAYTMEEELLFVIATVISAPVMAGALEMGNIAFLVTILLIIALYLKDSDDVRLHETALVLIAVCAGLKIYPAIIGVLYIKERRWKEAVRLVIYGLIVFFVPFAFCGGIPSIIQYLKLMLFYENLGQRSWTNIRNYLLAISDLIGAYERSASFVKYFKIIENLFLLFCIASVFKTKTKWKAYLYTAGIMSLYIPFSYRYVSSYMLIPLVYYLREESGKISNRSISSHIYPILFGCTFTLPVWGLLTALPAEFFIFTPLYLIMIYSFFEDWCIHSFHKKRDNSTRV